MSYFEDEERKMLEEEREQAEIDASNERQRELDEHIPHIEKLEDGSWVGSVDISITEMESIDCEKICQDIFEAIEEVREKSETEKKFYQVMRFRTENHQNCTFTLYVKLQHIEQED